MINTLDFAILAIATMLAVASAAALCWMFLGIAFVLMEPAAARRVPPGTDLGRGTTALARAYAGRR